MGAGVGMCVQNPLHISLKDALMALTDAHHQQCVCARQKSEMHQNLTILLDLRLASVALQRHTHKYPYLHVCTKNYKTTR